jgi:hypothetical protein
MSLGRAEARTARATKPEPPAGADGHAVGSSLPRASKGPRVPGVRVRVDEMLIATGETMI